MNARRLEMEPTGISEGRSLWWSRVARRALLAKAIVDAVTTVDGHRRQGGDARTIVADDDDDDGAKRSSTVSSNQQSPSALEKWLDRAAIATGPF